MATQTKKSGRSQTRQNAPKNLWTAPAKPLHYGREQFRFHLTRAARKLATLEIDPWVQTVNWQRNGQSRSGELNFSVPLGAHAANLIANGDFVVCEWDEYGTGTWHKLWEMKVVTPSQEIQQGLLTIALASQLAHGAKSKVAWKFRTDKTHPHGWNAQTMTVAVCRRFHIPIGKLPKATHHIDRYVNKSQSPTDVITWAWTQERKHTGRRFDIDTSSGILNVTEIKEPRFMLVLGADMLDGTVTQSLGNVASAVVATATHKQSGKKREKLRVRVVDTHRRDEYGYIVKTLHAPAGIQSVSELRTWAKRQLGTLFRGRKKLNFTHPGLPLVDRGTPLRVYLPEADLAELVFVTSARHDLSAGDYEMEIDVGFDDPAAAADTSTKKPSKADSRSNDQGGGG